MPAKATFPEYKAYKDTTVANDINMSKKQAEITRKNI